MEEAEVEKASSSAWGSAALQRSLSLFRPCIDQVPPKSAQELEAEYEGMVKQCRAGQVSFSVTCVKFDRQVDICS